MQIKSFTIADLRAALSSHDFWGAKTLPITKHRALAHTRNPRAREDDIVLVVAYRKQSLAGYLGILPDNVHIAAGTHKIGWLTGWWVDPDHASAGIGTALLFRALNAHRSGIGVSGSSKAATRVLEASRKFVSITPLKGIEVRLQGDLSGVKHAAPVDRPGFEYISAVDAETGALLERHNRYDLVRRDKANLDWITSCPWILTAPLKDAASRKFYFSSIAARFFHLGVKVLDPDGELVGFFLLKVRDDAVTLLFSWFEDRHAGTVAAAVIYHASALEAKSLGLYDRRLVAEFERIRPAHWPTRAVSRGFLLTEPLADLPWAECRLQGGDGDLAFY